MPASEATDTSGPAGPGQTGKLYYGWVIVAVMATVGAASMAMGTLNFGLFIKPMGQVVKALKGDWPPYAVNPGVRKKWLEKWGEITVKEDNRTT